MARTLIVTSIRFSELGCRFVPMPGVLETKG